MKSISCPSYNSSSPFSTALTVELTRVSNVTSSRITTSLATANNALVKSYVKPTLLPLPASKGVTLPFLTLPPPSKILRRRMGISVHHGIHNPPAPSQKRIDIKVFKEKLSINWAGPFKSRSAGPFSAVDTLDAHPLGNKLMYTNFSSVFSGPASKPRVTVEHYKPCINLFAVASKCK